ncbi:hypothetical protein HID58_058033 [Brassica napus]|uniref:Uncharacterized protein n=1 Tax=Brassica napus TaxID=3708 RepID=A0ABQ7ZNW0_BRANA|nr:hypothetical protein HID58_058033 [Brassica napus]
MHETRVKISNHSLPPESARKHDDGTPPTAEANRGESAQSRNSHLDRRRRPRLTDRSFASGYSNAYTIDPTTSRFLNEQWSMIRISLKVK